MSRLLVLTLAWGLTPGALAGTNLVQNPGFERDEDGDGVPDGWQVSGQADLVTQTLSLDRGPDGSRCARLDCTRFVSGEGASHAMLAQMGAAVERGKEYRLRFQARGRGIEDGAVLVALSDTTDWANNGLRGAFVPMPDWTEHQLVFRATRDGGPRARLQFWFTSTGTLWLDDVRLEEVEGGLYRPGEVLDSAGLANFVPNGSFECGTTGWGSESRDPSAGWGGGMNRLWGELDRNEAVDGAASLRIDLAIGSHQPVSYFDYYELQRTAIAAPLAANRGFLGVEPGRRYTLSIHLKAREPGTPALLAVREFDGGLTERRVTVSDRWERYSLTFTPSKRWCYVLAGPDLRRTRETPEPPRGATLWLDAVQLEPGESPTPFAPRQAVELGLETEKVGNVFDQNEPIRIKAIVAAGENAAAGSAGLQLRVTDYRDEEVWRDTIRLDVAPGGQIERQVTLPESPQLRGFLRLHARLEAGGVTTGRALRMAAIPTFRGEDSRFGVNHAYPWPHLLDLCRQAGILWVRDWSCKWQEVEPEPGRFTFAESDAQIDRVLEHGLKVLNLLPFPSSRWASSAPADLARGSDYMSGREHVAYAPRDADAFTRYVARTVDHYKDRLRWWQVFNEPLFTSYSLPAKAGYDGKDYARWVRRFAQAARAEDPECRILAGIGTLEESRIDTYYADFFAEGGLEAADAIDIHHYPGLRPPESIERSLARLNELMEQHGGRKPLWLTEYGYYADDDPSTVPMPSSGFDTPLPSERVQVDYTVRWTVLMLAAGVEKLFYHAGSCDGVNRDSLQGVFFEYAGEPHQIYAAQAVMADLFRPSCQFVSRLPVPEPARGYLFRDGARLVAAVWSPAGPSGAPLRLGEGRIEARDVMGRPVPGGEVVPDESPVYLLADGLTDAEFVAALGLDVGETTQSEARRP